MIFARFLYCFSLLLAALLLGLAINEILRYGSHGIPLSAWVQVAIVGIVLIFCLIRTVTSRIVVGVVYGLFALQAFLFALIAIPRGPNALWHFSTVIVIGLFFSGMCAVYFLYSPLKTFLRNKNV